jgi:hypothetical protein
MEVPDRFIRVPEAAAMIGVGKRLGWQLLSEGVLTRHKLPGHRCTLVSVEEVQRYIRKLKGEDDETVS